jgi:hypothetical protein
MGDGAGLAGAGLAGAGLAGAGLDEGGLDEGGCEPAGVAVLRTMGWPEHAARRVRVASAAKAADGEKRVERIGCTLPRRVKPVARSVGFS